MLTERATWEEVNKRSETLTCVGNSKNDNNKKDSFVMEIMSCTELGSFDCTEIPEFSLVLDTDVKHG